MIRYQIELKILNTFVVEATNENEALAIVAKLRADETLEDAEYVVTSIREER